MTYNPAIPGPNDTLSQSQAQIQTNFSQADTIFDLNHVTYDNISVASRGKHRRVDLIQVAAPGSIANEAVVYQKAVTGIPNIFMQRNGNATEIQMTRPENPVLNNTGSTFLPGGILMNWGSVVGSPTGAAAVFATPFTAAIYVVTLGVFDGVTGNRTATWVTSSLAQILILSPTNNLVSYIAIGV